jgi:hypothetical protein
MTGRSSGRDKKTGRARSMLDEATPEERPEYPLDHRP